jgi:O-antigen ligase
MQKADKRSPLSLLALATVSLVTITISPWSVDPFNAPKQSVLILLSFTLFALTLAQLNYQTLTKFKIPMVLMLLFICLSIFSWIFSDNNTYQNLYGIFLRNNGFITYLSLCFIFISILVNFSLELFRNFSFLIMSIGNIVAIFGYLQYFEIMPQSLRTSNQTIVGVFGNTNFQSAFLGFSCIASFAYILHWNIKQKSFLFSVLTFISSSIEIFIINLSYSSQGIFIALLGISFSIFVKIRSSLPVFFTYLYTIPSLLLFIIGIFGTFNRGPLARIIYDNSLTDRGYCMRTGINMIKSEPIFGVGFDGYGDRYRLFRSSDAVVKKGTDYLCDTSHSVILDIGVFGGFPLFLIYLAIVLLAVNSIYKVLKRSRVYDSAYAAIVGTWVGYQIQSVISINQIGIGVWGWTLTSLIIGYEICTRNPKDARGLNGALISPSRSLITILGLLFGLILSIPNYLYGVNFSESFKTLDADKIIKASTSKPFYQYPMWIASYKLLESGLNAQSLQVAEKLVQEFPNSYDGWRIIHSNPITDQSLKEFALKQMSRLDPKNKDLASLE